MKYPSLPVLLFILLSCSAMAESGSYRVEVIVFRNLAEQVTPGETDFVRSFSRFPALEDRELPDDFSVVDEKSGAMDRAWRRLRSSGSYRPLLYAAWKQERIEYYPPIHIHNDQVIGSRLHPQAQATGQSPGPREADTAAVPARAPAHEPPTGEPSPALEAGANEAVAAAAPEPVYDNLYQLDGTVQLRRSRFLHLDLDLEYRLQADELPEPEQGNFNGATRIYHFNQSRQVNTGEMQYFDSPYFGALVLVTAVPAR
jgi:hypothetical protein